MATTSQNTQMKHQLGFIRCAIDSTVNSGAINAGDLVYWTGQGAASFGAGLTFNAALVALLGKTLGVSKDLNPLVGGQNPSTILDIGIYDAGEFVVNTTSGDTLTHLAPVTIGTDAQTVTLESNYRPSMTGATATGSSGTWGAGTYALTATYLSSLGETLPGVSANVTLTSAQGILTPALSLPSWAVGVCFYVNGVFAAYASVGTAQTLNSPSTNPRVAPVESALAIGYAYMPYNPTANTTSVAGGSGVTIDIRLKQIYPHNGLI